MSTRPKSRHRPVGVLRWHALAASMCVALASAAGAQSAPRATRVQVLPTITVTATAPRTDDRPFALDDALLHGIALSDAQRADVAQLRRLQLAEQESARDAFLGAVDAMRRAQRRGDRVTAGAIMDVLQADMEAERTWRLAALRALLSPKQRRLFDANADALAPDRAPGAADGGDRAPE
jgi:hypothetical protein